MLITSCDRPALLRSSAIDRVVPVDPEIPFVADGNTDWPIWQTGVGWVVGGSGFRLGGGDPTGATPGFGMGAILLPSRRIGTWTVFPGVFEPDPLDPTFPVWLNRPKAAAEPDRTASLSRSEPQATDRKNTGGGEAPPEGSDKPKAKPKAAPTPIQYVVTWTRMGPTQLPRPVQRSWPEPPVYMAPWGPVDLKPWTPPSDRPLLPMGFPPADGTPVASPLGDIFIRQRQDQREFVVFDLLSRTLHRPPSLIPIPDVVGVSQKGNLVLARRASGDVYLLDLGSGGIDPLPEIRGGRDYSQSRKGEFIAYTAVRADGRREVRLFDRRTRLVDTLGRLNGGAEIFDPSATGHARLLGVTIQRDGHTDIGVYDTVTGLLDPLPGVNTGANQFSPDFDDSGRWLAYLTDEPGRVEVRILDLATRAIDTLPEINVQAPLSRIDLRGDGYLLFFTFLDHGLRRTELYLRTSGIIDPLPEVNLPGLDVTL